MKNYKATVIPLFFLVSYTFFYTVFLISPAILRCESFSSEGRGERFFSSASCENDFHREEKDGKGRGAFSGIIRFYQHYISPIDGSTCSMYPSCSEFARQAVMESGIKGVMMTFDRLLRCGRDSKDYSLIWKDGRAHYDDPVGGHSSTINTQSQNSPQRGF